MVEEWPILNEMKVVNLREAKANLSRLNRAVENGEEILIARGNTPVVKLVLVESAQPKRMLGWAKGVVKMADDFDAPLECFAEYRTQ